MSSIMRKPVFGVFDQVPSKLEHRVTEDVKKLEIRGLGSRGIVLFQYICVV